MKRGARRSERERREVDVATLHAIVERARTALSEEEHQILKESVDTLAELTAELEKKGVSIRRLRKLLFGASTEKTATVLDDEKGAGGKQQRRENAGDPHATAEGNRGPGDGPEEEDDRKKGKGHGRNGANAYHGLERVRVLHGSLGHGDHCPDCRRGNVYRQRQCQPLIRLTGMAPINGRIYELEQLRCGTCGKVFKATAPPGIGEKKYDESVSAMIALLKYGTGLPFYRLEKLQRSMGIPLPAATQWDLVKAAAMLLIALLSEMIRQAAQGEVVQNDDTTMTILALPAERPSDPVSGERSGVYTSCILCRVGPYRIALFFTGLRHAGDNMEKVLEQRAAELGPPIQMSDGLSHNTAGDFESIEANCIAHARRYFVDVTPSFPEECRFVLETLREVYRTDARARSEAMDDDQRLRLHQAESGPRMENLRQWLNDQLEQKKVEPNSGLGEAIRYMQKRWEKLTRFLVLAGVPLDNNLVEQALKRAILHRKNSLFYKSQNGARVGDLFMSLIHTAELNGADPFLYLLTLLRHHALVAADPAQWMPWNYRDTLASIEPAAGTRLETEAGNTSSDDTS
jgi:hypothetical protein